MPIHQDPMCRGRSADLRGPLSAGEVEALAADTRLRNVTVRPNEPAEFWRTLDVHLFARRHDVKLLVDNFFSDPVDLAFLRLVPKVRRLGVARSWPTEVRSFDALADVEVLESLAVGSPGVESFDLLDRLPAHALRELHLADSTPHTPSLRPVARFHALERLHLTGHARDIESVRSLRSLKVLRLDVARLPGLDLLRGLPTLVSLTMSQCTAGDASALADLPRLRHLDLHQVRDIESLDFLAGLLALEWLELSNLPRPTGFPDLSRLSRLLRVALRNLNRIESLGGLARAPALEEFEHAGLGMLPPTAFDPLLDHPTLRCFTATVRSAASNAALAQAAARRGKKPVDHVSRPADFEP